MLFERSTFDMKSCQLRNRLRLAKLVLSKLIEIATVFLTFTVTTRLQIAIVGLDRA